MRNYLLRWEPVFGWDMNGGRGGGVWGGRSGKRQALWARLVVHLTCVVARQRVLCGLICFFV